MSTNGSLAVVTLTPPQSKKLLAEAVASHPLVQRALREGTIIIGHGTTNAWVASRLLGETLDEVKFAAGIVRGGDLDVTDRKERLPAVVMKRGRRVDVDPQKALADFGRGDLLIKGGNAVDPEGIVGVLMASREGGTIGRSLGIVMARGAVLMMPVGLEKLIPSVPRAVRMMGQDRVGLCTGEKSGLMPVVGALVITEIEAFRLLAGVEAVMVAAGGWGDSQGAVTLSLKGTTDRLQKAFQWTMYVKGKRPDRPS